MERTLDYKGRWRNHTVAFRVSDEEAKLLNDLVALSGLTKQDYITRRLLCRDVAPGGGWQRSPAGSCPQFSSSSCTPPS